MIARMLPGFLLAPIGGALVDRWNRKVVMVTCDIGRVGLLVVLPFWDNLLGLVVISFSIEVLTLLWGPAKDASVPNIVKDPDQLASANSLGLVAAFGTFPVGSLMFALLAAVASWLGNFDVARPPPPRAGVARDLGRRPDVPGVRVADLAARRCRTASTPPRLPRPIARPRNKRGATSSTECGSSVPTRSCGA